LDPERLPVDASVHGGATFSQVPKQGTIFAVCKTIPRSDFLALLYILGCANGLLGRLILSSQFADWEGALAGADINAIMLLACFAGISLVSAKTSEHLQPRDLGVGLIFLLLISLPIFPLSWVAVTGLSLYILLFANTNPERTRGALILLAMTAPMLWSRLLFQIFAKPILDIDATLVSLLLGTDRTGNMVGFLDKSGYMIVLPACSSLANMSLALLCWVTITQWAGHRWNAKDVLWAGLACASVIAVNVTRISLMGLNHRNYEAIHNSWGDMITNSIMLALMVGVTVLGARREIFARV
jgi:exosortase/archaeosortase family protein